jgi:hypothetical protein
MITSLPLNDVPRADVDCHCCWGNILFMIAGTIGLAIKNGYDYGFTNWANQEFFVNPLPVIEEKDWNLYRIPVNYKGYDVGFRGFNIPDDRRIIGGFGSEKYFKHCEDAIRHYFTMKGFFLLYDYSDHIVISYREYEPAAYNTFARLGREYFIEALKRFPSKKVLVVTNDVKSAKETIQEDFEYVHASPIVDFYLLTKAEYLIMSNSTFSWWGAWLSKAKVIAPSRWFDGNFKDCPTEDLYCDGWEMI